MSREMKLRALQRAVLVALGGVAIGCQDVAATGPSGGGLSPEAVEHTFEYTPPPGAPSFTSIHVPGAHNNWNETRTPMTLDNGVWRATVMLLAGRHEYKFNIDDYWVGNMCGDETWGHRDQDFWVDPAADGCVDDGFGGANAYIDIK